MRSTTFIAPTVHIITNSANNSTLSYKQEPLSVVLSGLIKINDSDIYLLTENPEINLKLISKGQLARHSSIITSESLAVLEEDPKEINLEGLIELLEVDKVDQVIINVHGKEGDITNFIISKAVLLSMNVNEDGDPDIKPLSDYSRCLSMIMYAADGSYTSYCYKIDDYSTLYNDYLALAKFTNKLEEHYDWSNINKDDSKCDLFKYLDSYL